MSTQGSEQEGGRCGAVTGRIRGGVRASGRVAFLGLVTLWVVSRVLTDRVGGLQLAWWTPSWVYLAASLVAFWVAWGSLRRRGRLVGLCVLLAIGAWWLGPEWRLHRGPHRIFGALGERTVRIVFWNAWGSVHEGAPDRRVADGDLVILANAWRSRGPDLIDGVWSDGRLGLGRFTLWSAFPVLETGYTELGFTHRHSGAEPGEPGAVDTGAAAFVVLGAPGADEGPGAAFPRGHDAAGGGTLVVWMLDLPSSPMLSRHEVALQARGVIERYAGRRDGGEGFPAPDVIVGDFNIPRGSASLGLIAPGTRDAASDTTGALIGTWPRRFPLLWIDNARLGERVRAVTYESLDPGVSRHRAIGLDVQAKGL